MPGQTLHVCIVGGGIGGLAAATALRRAGAEVTVLEQAPQLGEIGAGIQMFGNVSRFLVRTGIDRIIGDNLVAHQEVRTWSTTVDGTPDPMGTGKLTSKISTQDVVRDQGFPWWVVRRDHLHAGLAEGAKRHGAELIVDSRVSKLEANDHGVKVTTEKGKIYHFDLVIGADGINSVVRQNIFPDLKPQAATTIAAYRSVVPYETVFDKIPEARSILGNTMDAWSGPGGYILLYPLSAGRELNVVSAMHQDHHVKALEDPPIEEFRNQYKDFPPFIRKVLDLVPSTRRWPLLVVPPTKTWSNEYKNIVLMGDAIHGMQNHMAQGAATSIEDGMFLGRIISEVLRDTISLQTGIHLYEKKRIPRAWHKQQSALCQGEMWSVFDPATKQARDNSEFAQVTAWSKNPANPREYLAPMYRSTMLFMNPWTVPGILYYDAEGDADFAVGEWLMNQSGVDDQKRLVSSRLMGMWWKAVWDNGVKRWTGGEGTERWEGREVGRKTKARAKL